MTRAQLNALVVSWLDDLNQTYFTPTQVNMWLNLAQRSVQSELLQAGSNWYVKVVETQTTIGQTDYLYPSDFRVEHRLELVLSGTGPSENRQQIGPMTINQQDLVSVVLGTPTNYYLKKDRFTIMPTPSQQWTMRLYYSPLVADMQSDSDSPDVPEEFMEYVALTAAFDGFIKDDRAPENLVMKKEGFKELLKRMAVDRNQDQSRQVVTVNEYDFGAWY